MAKKITISVSDELHEKMKEWKSALNFSKVFQNAVSGMILKKEALKNRLMEEIDLASIVDRLKKEKLEFETNIVEKGKNDGLEWSKTAHYRELQYALAWNPDGNPALDDELGDYFAHILNKYKERVSARGKMAQDRINGFLEKYLSGWKEGVEQIGRASCRERVS
jgi:hypothetical protein